MLKRIISILCACALIFCVACNKNKIEVPQGLDSTDMETFLQVVSKVDEAESFYTVAEGVTKSLGISQEISSRRYVIGDKMFKESISSSSIVKVATQVYVANGKYLVRGNKKVTSVSSVAWSTSATDIGKDEYLKRYGSVILGLNNYILNDDTIDGIELTKESDKYIFVINANVEKATKNIVKEMKTNANSKSEPVFSVAKLTITTDSSLNVISVKYECVYKVEVAVLGKVECTENMTEYYYGFNQTTTFPEEGFFNQFL